MMNILQMGAPVSSMPLIAGDFILMLPCMNPRDWLAKVHMLLNPVTGAFKVFTVLQRNASVVSKFIN